MGTVTHSITLHSADGYYTETLDALVDTGSTFLTVPRPVLERLGVEPMRVIRLRLANG
jgi:predicted aspartyl protease